MSLLFLSTNLSQLPRWQNVCLGLVALPQQNMSQHKGIVSNLEIGLVPHGAALVQTNCLDHRQLEDGYVTVCLLLKTKSNSRPSASRGRW
jgi:hypothetical protein